MTAYGTDLAFIHDAGHGALPRHAALQLLDELRGAGHRRGTIVDLGCGSGILAGVVVDAGYEVFGIDVSSAMIALAQARVPKGTFTVGSFVSSDIPECVAVAAIGEVLTHPARPCGHSQHVARGRIRRADDGDVWQSFLARWAHRVSRPKTGPHAIEVVSDS